MKNIQNKIRLPEEYIKYIKFLTDKYFPHQSVWVFGSRVDMSQRGGDIDIFIKTNTIEDTFEKESRFIYEMHKKFGEQKIDLIVQTKNSSPKEIFQTAQIQGIKL